MEGYFFKFIWEFVKKNWKGVLIISLSLMLIVQCSNLRGMKSENKRLTNNFYAQCDSADVWKTKSGTLASKTKNMEVTIDELQALYGDSRDKIKDLNIKIKDLESYQHGTITKHIHDTVILRDTIMNKGIYKSGTYMDGCVTCDFLVSDSVMVFDFMARDTIDIFISAEKQGSWWKFWTFPRPRVYTTTASSHCPNTTVMINSYKITK